MAGQYLSVKVLDLPFALKFMGIRQAAYNFLINQAFSGESFLFDSAKKY